MKKTKQQQVYEYIKDKINSNEYPPGTPLTEESICAELKVSRTPVRDAIRRLTSENLLVITPGIGLSVSSIGLEDLIEIFDIREGLEVLSVRLFIERAPDATIKLLHQYVEEAENALKNGDYNTYMHKDMEFHRLIDATVGNKRLSSMLDVLYEQINRLAYTNKEDPEVSKMGVAAHEDLIKYIEDRDLANAANAMGDHIKSVKRYYLSKYFNI